MPSPVTIVAFDGFGDFPGFVGPYVDGSNLFVTLVNRSTNAAQIYKSSNSGVTWAQFGVDFGISTTAGSQTIRALKDVTGAHTLWVAYIEDTSNLLRIVDFNTSTGAWGTPSTTHLAPTPLGFGGGLINPNFDFAQRATDGTFIVYFSDQNGLSQEVTSVLTFDPTGGTFAWGSPFQVVPPGSSSLIALQNCILSASGSDDTQGFLWDDTPEVFIEAVQYFFNTAGHVLSTSFGGRYHNAPMTGHALSWNNSGTWRLVVPHTELTDLHSIDAPDHYPPTAAGTDTLVDAGALPSGGPLTSAARLSTTNYIFAANQPASTRSMGYYTNSGGGWSSFTDLVLPNAWAASVAPCAGGLGLVFDDAPTVSSPLDHTKFLLLFAPPPPTGSNWCPGYIL